MDLRRPRVCRRSNVGLVITCTVTLGHLGLHPISAVSWVHRLINVLSAVTWGCPCIQCCFLRAHCTTHVCFEYCSRSAQFTTGTLSWAHTTLHVFIAVPWEPHFIFSYSTVTLGESWLNIPCGYPWLHACTIVPWRNRCVSIVPYMF